MLPLKLLQARYKLIIFALAGVLILGIGILMSRINPSVSGIEIVEATPLTLQSASTSAVLVAEIGGEVINPGVYKLSKDARVDDLLNASGGLTESADEEWIEKFINKAAKVIDGQKVIIPSKAETSAATLAPIIANQQKSVLSASNNGEGSGDQTISLSTPASAASGAININTASKSKLEELWGIGPVTAQKIIDQRPYSATDELIKKKIIKSNVWERIKNEITVN